SHRLVCAREGFVDQRSCNGCTCSITASSCSNRKLAFYGDAACAGDHIDLPADNTCRIAPAGAKSYYRYEPTATGGACAAIASTVGVIGAVTAPAKQTLCCK